MVTNVMLINQVIAIRIGANLAIICFTKLDAKILTKRLKVRTHDSSVLFAKLCYPTNSTK
jgi:hypothetical protein